MKHNIITITAHALPPRLQTLPQPISQLYTTGEYSLATLLDRPIIAIVGTRKPTAYGIHCTKTLAYELAAAGFVIVSGLALGIDALAHQAALDAGGQTIAVLPCGIETVYPRSNLQLASRVAASGCLVSEYPADLLPQAYQFIARNRIIAALADAILIPEAAERSGSLHTAMFGLELGKQILAVPGPITSPLSRGTNGLIRSGATLVRTADDVLESLSFVAQPSQRTLRFGDTPGEQAIIDALSSGSHTGDELQAITEQDARQTATALSMLELAGTISSIGNDTWILR
jgi:DNA processing protein